MRLHGHCHCGTLSFVFETEHAPAELPLRACQCSFCRLHGVLSTSDPEGSVSVMATDPALVQRYRFGLGISDFLLCRHCGVYVVAVAEMDGRYYAVINANTMERFAEMGSTPRRMDYDAEDAQMRRARRKARWTPVISLPGE